MKNVYAVVMLAAVSSTAIAQSDTDKSHKQGERKSPDVVDSRDEKAINNSNKDMGYQGSRKRENDPEPREQKKKNDCPGCR